MNGIVAVNETWGIGANGGLLVSLPPDLKRFRALTWGKTVITGRKTLRTFPGEKPLEGRKNLILSGRKDWTVPGAVVCADVEQVLEQVQGMDPEDVFVIGGESVYRAFLPFCHKIYVTQFQGGIPADRFFPNLDLDPQWEIGEEDPWQEFEGIPYRYVLYRRTGI